MLGRLVSRGRFGGRLAAASPPSWASATRADSWRCFAQSIKVPNMGDSISQGTVQAWEVDEGEWAEKDSVVVLVETDKTTVEVRAPEAGLVTKHLASEEDDVEVGQALFELDSDAEAPAGAATPKPAAPEAAKPAAAAPAPAAAASAAPAAAAPAAAPAPAVAAPVAAPAPPAPKQAGSRSERVVKMTRMRQAIARNLKETQNTKAMLTTFQEVDCSGLINMRKELGEDFLKSQGIKLGFMSTFVKAASKALEDQPIVNATVAENGTEIIYRDFVDISVAVASPHGLVVPVLRNVEDMSFADVEKNIVYFGQQARDGKLALEDMAGGTFSISNGGVFGSLMGTPIINSSQSAILGMHGIFDRPAAVDGKVEIRPMMYLALTYDHRIMDGREASLFLRSIKKSVEDPRAMLLGV